MRSQLKKLWAYVEQLHKDEEQQPEEPNFEELDADKVQQTIDHINHALQAKI